MSLKRSPIAARIAAVASACSQGVFTLPSSFHEFMMNRGLSAQACAQRIRSSASGTGPAKPPTSWPVSNNPESPIVSAIRWFQRNVLQLVVLSPVQVWA